jgi:hypothetical protein
VTIRCTLDGLLLPARIDPSRGALVALDGDEPFILESLEALFYELVSATRDEIILLQRARYRLLRIAADFECADS